MFSTRLRSISDLKDFVIKHRALILKPRQILLLEGDMGTGKTEFVKQLVSAASGEIATSPSFGLHHSYPLENFSIEHLDLYRLEGEQDLQSIGFWDLFENENSLIIIEWAQKLSASRLPLSWKQLRIRLSLAPDGSRDIQLESNELGRGFF